MDQKSEATLSIAKTLQSLCMSKKLVKLTGLLIYLFTNLLFSVISNNHIKTIWGF